jgi:hypothetical protein
MWLDLAASFRVLEVQPPDDEGENRRDESDDQQRVDVVINVGLDPVRERSVCRQRLRVRLNRVTVPDNSSWNNGDDGHEHPGDIQEEVLRSVLSLVGDERECHEEHATDENCADGGVLVSADGVL